MWVRHGFPLQPQHLSLTCPIAGTQCLPVWMEHPFTMAPPLAPSIGTHSSLPGALPFPRWFWTSFSSPLPSYLLSSIGYLDFHLSLHFSLELWILKALEAQLLNLSIANGWEGWMASPTRWTWVWVNSRSWWWTGRPGMLWFMGSQGVGHDWATELNWIFFKYYQQRFFTLLYVRSQFITVQKLSSNLKFF